MQLVFKCTETPLGNMLVADMSVECPGDEAKFGFGAILFIFGLGTPLALFALVYLHREELKNWDERVLWIKHILGFYVNQYRPEYAYFEAVVTMKKFIELWVTFFFKEATVQATILVLLSFVYSGLILKLDPYRALAKSVEKPCGGGHVTIKISRMNRAVMGIALPIEHILLLFASLSQLLSRVGFDTDTEITNIFCYASATFCGIVSAIVLSVLMFLFLIDLITKKEENELMMFHHMALTWKQNKALNSTMPQNAELSLALLCEGMTEDDKERCTQFRTLLKSAISGKLARLNA